MIVFRCLIRILQDRSTQAREKSCRNDRRMSEINVDGMGEIISRASSGTTDVDEVVINYPEIYRDTMSRFRNRRLVFHPDPMLLFLTISHVRYQGEWNLKHGHLDATTVIDETHRQDDMATSRLTSCRI